MPIENYKILIVDDHSLSRTLLRIQLGNFGFVDERIAECQNGKEGLDYLCSNKIDIAVIDWDMPDMDGLEMLQAYEAQSHKKYDTKTAFVMVSAEAQPERILHALNAGVICYITKPVSQVDINEKMTKVLGWIERH